MNWLKQLDPDRKTGLWYLCFFVVCCVVGYAGAGLPWLLYSSIAAAFVSFIWGMSLACDGVVKPIDQDRKNGPPLIMVLLVAFIIANNTTSESVKITGMLIGMACFMWVMVLMGKAVDKHGWGDGTGRDNDDDEQPPKK
jgi:hypothetical protein